MSLLEQKGYDPMAYRLFCLQSHYRRNLVFSWENLDNAVAAYDKLIAKIAALKDDGEVDADVFNKLKERFVGALNGDLNTSVAVTALYDVLKAKCNDATKLAAIARLRSGAVPESAVRRQDAAGEADAGGAGIRPTRRSTRWSPPEPKRRKRRTSLRRTASGTS